MFVFCISRIKYFDDMVERMNDLESGNVFT